MFVVDLVDKGRAVVSAELKSCSSGCKDVKLTCSKLDRLPGVVVVHSATTIKPVE